MPVLFFYVINITFSRIKKINKKVEVKFVNSDIEEENNYLFLIELTPNCYRRFFPSLTREGIFVVSFVRGELKYYFLFFN